MNPSHSPCLRSISFQDPPQPSPSSRKRAGSRSREEGREEVLINDYSKTKDPLIVQAEQLVLHFHKTFLGTETHSPQSKETAQALSLLTKYGIEKARHVIEFAH